MEITGKMQAAKMRLESEEANEWLTKFYNEDGTFKGDDFSPPGYPSSLKRPSKVGRQPYNEYEANANPFSRRALMMMERRSGVRSDALESIKEEEQERVDQFLEAMANLRTAPLSLAQRIIKAVATRHKISVADLKGAGQAKHLTLARQECCYMLYTKTSLSMTQIGRMLNRHHTTVLYSIRKFAKKYGCDIQNERVRQCLIGHME